MSGEYLCCADLWEHDQATVWFPATITSLRKVSLASDGTQRIQVGLADASGEIRLLVPRELESRAPELRLMHPVMAEVQVATYHWGMGGILLRWQPAFFYDIDNEARLLPACHCPDPAKRAHQGLVEGIDNVRTPCLRDAMNALVRCHAARLMSAPASWSDHHAYPGGLLVHTVEVMQRAGEEAHWLFPFDQERYDLIQLIAMAHDIAKADQYIPGASNPVADALGHKLTNTATVVPQLQKIASVNAELGRLGARMVEWLARPAHLRKIRECAEAELVQRADELSAMTAHTGGCMPINLRSESRVLPSEHPASIASPKPMT